MGTRYIYIPNLKLGIEYDGFYYHDKRRVYDLEKEKHITSGGIVLLKVQERGGNIQKCYRKNNIIYCSQRPSENHLAEVIKMCFDYISENMTTTRYNVDIDVARDRAKIFELYISNEKESSFLANYPNLAKQWHPTKNENITPKMIKPSSNKIFWWQCEKGHEWETSVNTRTNMGSGCPYCAGRRAHVENCLQTLNPDLAKEWHPEKNTPLTPCEVTVGSKRKVWWKCEQGHEWESVINNRIRGNGCPFCSGRFATLENSLQALNPCLAKQWHPTKNISLTPHNVLPFSNKKVWWRCEKGHEWEATIAKRSNGRGCPICARQHRAK